MILLNCDYLLWTSTKAVWGAIVNITNKASKNLERNKSHKNVKQ